ncbi:MAG TPA: OB-fold domain-containing protein [Streptosporangiaceae bacterium]|nr:OB-fold domain-containing protein [Streptosporangiaceae bacterium]
MTDSTVTGPDVAGNSPEAGSPEVSSPEVSSPAVGTAAADEQTAAILAAAEKVKAAGPGSSRTARDPVNLPTIRSWTDAIGDTNPVYTDPEFAAGSVHGALVAPPAMVQVWTMPGLRPPAADGDADPLGQMMTVLDAAGFTSVVATNCDQRYYRYLGLGELLSLRAELTDVSGPKRTALGEGWFVTTKNVWYSGDEPVAEMDWRVLKFRPQTASALPPVPADAVAVPAPAAAAMRPPVSPDTEFFWAGTRVGELRIQRCGACGALRHPPGPACLSCGITSKQEYQVTAGTGTVYSYVVHRHPPVPGKQLPIVIALVELTEGVRVMAELTGIDPDKVHIGLPVRTSFIRIDDGLVLPGWRPDERVWPGAPPEALPELTIEITPTVVVSTAIATRDFYPVHHDRDLAVQRGSQDIFLNILTTTGLVQRYVTDWAGPEAIVRAVSIRLGVPCYAGDTLTFSGRVIEAAGDESDSTGTSPEGGELVVAVTGRCSLGSHVTGTVRLAAGDAR